MNAARIIARFSTGVYTVTRTGPGATVSGRYTPGTPSTFAIDASVQVISGDELQALPVAQHGEELRKVITTTPLFTRTPTTEPDVVTIDGESWQAFHVERVQYGAQGTYYRAFVSRQVVP